MSLGSALDQGFMDEPGSGGDLLQAQSIILVCHFFTPSVTAPTVPASSMRLRFLQEI